MFSCSLFKPPRPSLTEVQNITFSQAQIDEVNQEMVEWIDMMQDYKMGMVNVLRAGEWKIHQPIGIRSDYKRVVAIQTLRSENDHETTMKNYMLWICGFRYKEKWYFFRPSESMAIPSEYYGGEKYKALSWEKLESIAEKEMKGYIKYSKKEKKWVINDLWIRGYMDNGTYLATEDDQISDKEIMALPEEYWIRRYMPFQVVSERVMERIDEDRETEDINYKNGSYSNEEWDQILKLRNPKTENDWKILRKYQKKFIEDPYINAALELREF